MKLSATCTPFEALPPDHWEGFKRQVIAAAKGWGLDITVSQDLTVMDAVARYWQGLENARAASKDG